MIDWPRLLDAQGVEYVESGPSTARNNIYVHCPFCGDADQGHHMGISTKGRGWGCWRNTNHRGKDPARLLSALLSISYNHASELVDKDSQPLLIGDEAVANQLNKMMNTDQQHEPKREQPLMFPPEIIPLEDRRSLRMFWDYLQERGYERWDIKILCRRYKLHCALEGLFKYRVIFPVYTNRGLVTWSGRSIVPEREPRYLTLTTDPEVAGDRGVVAKASIKDCLFNERELLRSSGRALIVSEGPIDAMRVDYVGRDYGVRATGLFGKVVSDAQIDTLGELAENYEDKYFLLDPDADLDNFAMWNKLSKFGYRAKRIKGYEDPGAMPIMKMSKFINEEILS